MRNRLFGILLVLLVLMSVLAGCGGAAVHENQTAADSGGGTSKAYNGEYGADDGMAETPPMDSDMPDSLAGGGSGSLDSANFILEERKIIRSADLTIEVENFDTAEANIESIIRGIGIIQESNINSERIYVNEEMKLLKSGTIVIRIKKAEFDSVINKLNGLGDVLNHTTNGQDVTEEYFDVEARIRLFKLERDKLESYVEKLDDLEEIFKAESKLTDLTYQIERLTGSLNKLNSLVELSTINVTLREKRPDYVPPESMSYGDKLVNSLKDSLLRVVEFFGDLLIFIVAALPVLIFLGLCVLFGVWVYKKIGKKRKNDEVYMRHPATSADRGPSSAQAAPKQAYRPVAPKQSQKQEVSTLSDDKPKVKGPKVKQDKGKPADTKDPSEE